MTVVKKFNKRHNEEIRISIVEFKGSEYIDIPLFYQNDEGEFLPTQKGIRFSGDLYGELADGVEKLREHCGDSEDD